MYLYVCMYGRSRVAQRAAKRICDCLVLSCQCRDFEERTHRAVRSGIVEAVEGFTFAFAVEMIGMHLRCGWG